MPLYIPQEEQVLGMEISICVFIIDTMFSVQVLFWNHLKSFIHFVKFRLINIKSKILNSHNQIDVNHN